MPAPKWVVPPILKLFLVTAIDKRCLHFFCNFTSFSSRYSRSIVAIFRHWHFRCGRFAAPRSPLYYCDHLQRPAALYTIVFTYSAPQPSILLCSLTAPSSPLYYCDHLQRLAALYTIVITFIFCSDVDLFDWTASWSSNRIFSYILQINFFYIARSLFFKILKQTLGLPKINQSYQKVTNSCKIRLLITPMITKHLTVVIRSSNFICLPISF